MEASDLRQYSPEELTGRIRQWKEELFRLKFKMQTSEARDTSVFKKLRLDIARAQTVLTEKSSGIVITSTKPPKTKKAASKKETREAAPAKHASETEGSAPEKETKAAAKKTAKKKKA